MTMTRFPFLLPLLLAGCAGRMVGPPTPTQAGLNPAALRDPVAEADACAAAGLQGLYVMAEQVRNAQRPPVLPPKRSVLVLSGGGSYGAYTAGVLVGWSAAGTRPNFDVVTGVSTGALVAALAFLGPEYDPELRRVYTTLKSDDIFRIKKSLKSVFGEGIADNSPLARQIREVVTPDFLAKVAAEHAKGRRLYVGTTDLDGRRQVVWDLGAVAARGTVESQDLFCRVLLASAAIPGLFAPVRIPVEVDGHRYEERHVDGGVTAALFFRAPWVPAEKRRDPAAASLYDSDLYLIVAGKLYADPAPVAPRTITIAAASVSALIDSLTRDELVKLFAATALGGMNYRLAAIPQEFPLTFGSTDFEPPHMSALFDEGVRQAAAGTAWRDTPPGLERGEGVSVRGGSSLSTADGGWYEGPRPPRLFPWPPAGRARFRTAPVTR